LTDRHWTIGIVGTFDVENYGDLLFPLLAEAELRRRLGEITLRRFSYNAKTWPYEVTSVADLPELASSLDAMLIGGGFLIRFDKEVAPGYAPPAPTIHHPTGYWLTPALIAAANDVPVIWNAPGTHLNDLPDWARPLMTLALEQSSYIAVRDEPSREALSTVIARDRVEVVPDTAFGLARLLPTTRSRALEALLAAIGITGPYVAVQSSATMQEHRDLFGGLPGLQTIALPVSPALSELGESLGEGYVRLATWPHPLLMAELIANAEAVVGHSYHLAITALTTGVPVFTSVDLNSGKFTALSSFDTIHPLPKDRAAFLHTIGRNAPVQIDVDPHWDRVADVIRAGRTTHARVAFNRFWQTLPVLLEGSDR
jgi:lipopolysaccharide transport system ATP-binding protein